MYVSKVCFIKYLLNMITNLLNNYIFFIRLCDIFLGVFQDSYRGSRYIFTHTKCSLHRHLSLYGRIQLCTAG